MILSILFLSVYSVAALNSTIGATGGLLIGIISLIIPPPNSVVLHSINSVVSSGHRSYSLRKYLDKAILPKFIIGSLVGLVIGFLITSFINENIWLFIIGIYMLVLAIFPNLLVFFTKTVPATLIFVLSGFASLLAGTGSKVYQPYILGKYNDKSERISNLALLATIQHFVKLPMLLYLTNLELKLIVYIPVIIIGAYLGNRVGISFLGKISEETQFRLQSSILALVGISLCVKAIV